MMGANSVAHNKVTFVTVPGLLKRGKNLFNREQSTEYFNTHRQKLSLNRCPMLYTKVITGAVDMAYYLEGSRSHKVPCSVWAW